MTIGMSVTTQVDELDDLFHFCAFAAFIEQSVIEKRSPDAEATRLRAYRHYEDALARKHKTLTTRTEA
jgi:hypothetical protein